MKHKIKATFYYKVSIVLNLIEQLREMGIELCFDNREVNNYKLIHKSMVYGFATYDSVIECLTLLLDLKKGKKI